MDLMRVKLIMLVAILTTLFACSTENDGIYFAEVEKLPETKMDYSPIELQVLDLVNNYRLSIGLDRLEKLDYISFVAQTHTNYMLKIGNVNHTDFNLRNEKLVLELNVKTVGENVAFGFKTAKEVVTAWLNSEKHKKTIENEHFSHFGISTKINNKGQYYFTNLFIEK